MAATTQEKNEDAGAAKAGRAPATIQETIKGGSAAEAQRTIEKARDLLPSFRDEAGLGSTLSPEAEAKCIAFIVEVILPISWYAAKIKRARWVRRGYFSAIAALTLSVPAGLVGLALWHDGSGQYLAQVGGVLTGLIALQRLIGMTLVAQHRYGAWWKASAELKKLWYGLLTARNALPAGTKTAWDDLSDDIERAIDQARAVVAEEQNDFFQKLSLPSFDIAEQLSKARTDVSGLVTALIPGAAAASAATATQATDLLRARRDIAKAKTLLEQIARVIQEKEEKLPTASEERKKEINASLAALRKRQDEAAIAELEAEAALAAATAR